MSKSDPAQFSTSVPRMSKRPLPLSCCDRLRWMSSGDDVTRVSARCVFIDAWVKKNGKLNMRWGKERIFTNQQKYVSPRRDKTRPQIIKERIFVIIRSAGQMFSCRKVAMHLDYLLYHFNSRNLKKQLGNWKLFSAIVRVYLYCICIIWTHSCVLSHKLNLFRKLFWQVQYNAYF